LREIDMPPAEADTFRRLVERQITTEEYVRTLDERAQAIRESTDEQVARQPAATDHSGG
jgi:hypothetical protein